MKFEIDGVEFEVEGARSVKTINGVVCISTNEYAGRSDNPRYPFPNVHVRSGTPPAEVLVGGKDGSVASIVRTYFVKLGVPGEIKAASKTIRTAFYNNGWKCSVKSHPTKSGVYKVERVA